jgi:hypothetical protein
VSDGTRWSILDVNEGELIAVARAAGLPTLARVAAVDRSGESITITVDQDLDAYEADVRQAPDPLEDGPGEF